MDKLQEPPGELDLWKEYIEALSLEGLHTGLQDDVVTFIENMGEKGWLHPAATEVQLRTRMQCWQCDEHVVAQPQVCISIPLGIQRNATTTGTIDTQALFDSQWTSSVLQRNCAACRS